jgi:hypothetical protein
MTRKLSILLALLAVALTAGGIRDAHAQAQNAHPFSFLSTASTNSTLVYAGPSQLQSMIIVNTTATIYYLKLYDTPVAPTCGSGTPVQRYPIPTSTVGGVIALSVEGMIFARGIGFCLTGALADADTTVAATGVVMNFANAWQ